MSFVKTNKCLYTYIRDPFYVRLRKKTRSIWIDLNLVERSSHLNSLYLLPLSFSFGDWTTRWRNDSLHSLQGLCLTECIPLSASNVKTELNEFFRGLNIKSIALLLTLLIHNARSTDIHIHIYVYIICRGPIYSSLTLWIAWIMLCNF